ncbi:MAG: aldo/keto reductase [Lentisphaeria bacterium]|nr:aldo/keto reductase [Lentisphaeria bacterium]NQZ66618.1 aldo/keto reductase [Lentisphaeria bacterium]
MQTRLFGNTGFQASEIGLGTWQLGGGFGDVSEETALSILQDAVDRGITFIDTADVYGAGISERVIGKFLKTTDKELFIATKFGRRDDVYPDTYSLELMREHVEDSLKNLGVDSIDLLQLHCVPTDVLRDGEIFDCLRILKTEGLIKHFGASVETMDEAKICMGHVDLTSLQIIFNIFRQNPSTEIFDLAIEKNVGIIVRLPLASGILAGKYSKDTTFVESDHRNFNKDGDFFSVGETFSGVKFDRGIELVEKIRPMVPENLSMAQFALRWILDHEAVSTIITGVTKLYQVESNAAVSNISPLGTSIHTELSDLYATEIKAEIRGVY